MRGKAISRLFFSVGNMVLLCLLLTSGAPGCKEKADQAGSRQETETVSDAAPEKEAAGDRQRQEVGAEEYENQLVFDLHEVSIFDLDEELPWEFLRGQMIFCDYNAGRGRPGQYPDFSSTKPIHGMISFAGTPAVQSPPRMYFHLAIDESAGTGTGYDQTVTATWLMRSRSCP